MEGVSSPVTIPNDKGRAYKKSILKRRLLEIRKKHKKSNEKLLRDKQLPLGKFNEQLFALCSKYQQDGVVSLQKMLLKKYHQKITQTNECKTATTKNTETGVSQKHLLDEIGHVREIEASDAEHELLERNLKKVATVGTVQLFNAINQCRANLKRKANESATKPTPLDVDKEIVDNAVTPANDDDNTNDNDINTVNIQTPTTNTPRNSLMHILRRRAKLSTENITK